MATANTLPLNLVSKDAKVFYILAQYSNNQPTSAPVVLKDGVLSKEGAVLFSVYSDTNPFPAGTIDAFKTYNAPTVFFIAQPGDNLSFSVKDGVLQGSGTAITAPILLTGSGFDQANAALAKNQALAAQPGTSTSFTIQTGPGTTATTMASGNATVTTGADELQTSTTLISQSSNTASQTTTSNQTSSSSTTLTASEGLAPWIWLLIIAGSLALIAIIAAIVWFATRASVEKHREKALATQAAQAAQAQQARLLAASRQYTFEPTISSETSMM